MSVSGGDGDRLVTAGATDRVGSRPPAEAAITTMGSIIGRQLRYIIAALPIPRLGSIFVVSHIGNNRSVLPTLLHRGPTLPASFALDQSFTSGHIYVAPPDHHLLLEATGMRLSRGPKLNHTCPAADPLFASVAAAFGKRVIGIVLSGGDGDGAVGLKAIKAHGGLALAQRPEDATTPSMPLAAYRSRSS
jgi:two-component system chemotaxis response regulator CheB